MAACGSFAALRSAQDDRERRMTLLNRRKDLSHAAFHRRYASGTANRAVTHRRLPGTTPTPEIIDLIRRCHLGSVILFSRNIRDNQQVLELTHSLQMIAKEAGQPYPLLIMADQENGLVNRLGPGTTTFPGNMALGAIGSEQIAFDIALATGREMKALGVNMNLAPVL